MVNIEQSNIVKLELSIDISIITQISQCQFMKVKSKLLSVMVGSVLEVSSFVCFVTFLATIKRQSQEIFHFQFKKNGRQLSKWRHLIQKKLVGTARDNFCSSESGPWTSGEGALTRSFPIIYLLFNQIEF